MAPIPYPSRPEHGNVEGDLAGLIRVLHNLVGTVG